jgi:NADH:ubiquinone oxidoreductase subunit F (NADH-binding)/DMSO/TMAO reductase YedYZ heme-binding membrane subunit
MPTLAGIVTLTGIIDTVLLTGVVVLGVLVHGRQPVPGLTRHGSLELHRYVALLAVVFLAAHVLGAVTGTYDGIGLAAIVVPFVSARQPLWIGLGAASLDLLAALVATSLLRVRLGWRAWRAVHWLAYACWPLALAHGVGIGPGLRHGRLFDLTVGCIAAVCLAAAWRLAGTLRSVPRARRVPRLMAGLERPPAPALVPSPEQPPSPALTRVTAAADLDAHLDQLGPVPYRDGPGLLTAEIRESGLTGRGGVSFPAYRKIEAVAAQARAGRAAVVVGNGAEGEPASEKDKALLREAPHLVLDGLQLAAEAVGADRGVLYISRGTSLAEWLTAQLAQRCGRGLDRVQVELVAGPPRFLAGEETAVARVISGGAAVPWFTPPRVSERGVDRRPTLVQNVETLAHLALIARNGAAWFRDAGTPEEPGTMLCTLRLPDGSVRVAEAALGTRLEDLADLARGDLARGDLARGGSARGDPARADSARADPARADFARTGSARAGSARAGFGGATAVLVGGYHGAWLPVAQATGLALSNSSLRPARASVGAGVVALLPEGRCGLAETARVVRYLALESAGQCGPCLNAMPRLAAELERLAAPHPSRETLANLGHWAGLVQGRGACRHPDGTVRLIGSALRAFGEEIRVHQQGGCSATTPEPFLPVPATPAAAADWR